MLQQAGFLFPQVVIAAGDVIPVCRQPEIAHFLKRIQLSNSSTFLLITKLADHSNRNVVSELSGYSYADRSGQAAA